jgi:hypothetical protein
MAASAISGWADKASGNISNAAWHGAAARKRQQQTHRVKTQRM